MTRVYSSIHIYFIFKIKAGQENLHSLQKENRQKNKHKRPFYSHDEKKIPSLHSSLAPHKPNHATFRHSSEIFHRLFHEKPFVGSFLRYRRASLTRPVVDRGAKEGCVTDSFKPLSVLLLLTDVSHAPSSHCRRHFAFAIFLEILKRQLDCYLFHTFRLSATLFV